MHQTRCRHSATCCLSPWCHPSHSRQVTHSRGAWGHCRCCPLGPECCRRAVPSPGSSGSSGCCCRPGVRKSRGVSSPESPASHKACPHKTSPGEHAPRDHCTSSHSLRFQRRRCSCTAPRSISAGRRKHSRQHSRGDTGGALGDGTWVLHLEHTGTRKGSPLQVTTVGNGKSLKSQG